MSRKKTAVVTGAAGFLGSHLSDLLLARDYKVIGMDNLITGNVRNIEHLAGNPDFDFIKHDVTKFIYLPGAIDLIFHFASPASPIDFIRRSSSSICSIGSPLRFQLTVRWAGFFAAATTMRMRTLGRRSRDSWRFCSVVIPSVSEGPGGLGGAQNPIFRTALPPKSLRFRFTLLSVSVGMTERCAICSLPQKTAAPANA